MKSAKALTVIGLLALAGTSSQVVQAEETGWYLGGNVGQANARIDQERINNSLIGAGFTTTAFEDDESDTGYKLFGGYQFTPNFAVEGGYFDLGNYSYTAMTLPPGSVTGRLEADGYMLDLLGHYDLTEKLKLFARLGANYAQTDVTFTGTGAANVFLASADERDLNTKYGVGLEYKLTRSLGLRLEAERYRIKDAVGHTGEIDLASLGLVYRFGQKAGPMKTAYAAPKNVEPPPPVVVVVPVVSTEEYCTILNAEFAINESRIQAADLERLRVVGTFLEKYPETTAVIIGHADNVGSARANMKLSRKRAQSVVDFIVKEYQIERSRLQAKGAGETQPIASNTSASGLRANRRVSAVIACATDIEGLSTQAARVTMAIEMLFDTDLATVRPEYHDALGVVAKYMKDHTDVSAIVQGHASNRNKMSAEGSMALSRERAVQVTDYLVSKFGVARTRLKPEAFGESDRFSYNTSAEGKQNNQRVNVVFTYPEG